jgi:hypothetical protein
VFAYLFKNLFLPKLWSQQKSSGCQGLGKRMNRQSTEDFSGRETTLYAAVMVGTLYNGLANV